jgi:hypothetical protein
VNRCACLCALVLTLSGLAAGCESTRTPESAVQALVVAARAGDRQRVWQLVGPRTRDRIRKLQAATHGQSGRVKLRPDQLLSVGWAPPAWEPSGMRTLRRDGTHAQVEVYSASGDRHMVELVREGTGWKIELPSS